IWYAILLDLLRSLSERECLSLGEHIREQDVVMPAERIERVVERDEVTGNESRALMDQLIKGMLTVGSRLTPINRAGVVCDRGSIERHVLPIALHNQLLQIGGKSLQVLFVGEDCNRVRSEKVT